MARSDTPKSEWPDRGQTFWRLIPMIFFGVIAYLALWLIFALAIIQFIVVVAIHRRNAQLDGFIRRLIRYMSEIFGYLTFAGDTMPFPFEDFPEAEPAPTPAGGNEPASSNRDAAADNAPAAASAGTSKSQTAASATAKSSGKKSGGSKSKTTKSGSSGKASGGTKTQKSAEKKSTEKKSESQNAAAQSAPTGTDTTADTGGSTGTGDEGKPS